MITILYVIGGMLFCIIAVLILSCVLFTINYVWMYRCHRCPHCKHFMEYKGLKEDNENGHFLFHCPHCGAWEQIAKEKFIRQEEDKT